MKDNRQWPSLELIRWLCGRTPVLAVRGQVRVGMVRAVGLACAHRGQPSVSCRPDN